jgi:hypothetical protein
LPLCPCSMVLVLAWLLLVVVVLLLAFVVSCEGVNFKNEMIVLKKGSHP